MRTEMFMPGLRPGSMSWSIYQAFAEALRDAGVDFGLLTDAPPGEAVPEAPGTRFLEVAEPGWRGRVTAPLTRTRTFPAHVRALARHLRRRPPDLLYMEMVYPLAAAAAVAARRARWRGPMVVAPMGEDLLTVEDAAYGFRRYRLPRYLVGRTLGSAAAIRCISPMIEEMTRDLPVPRPVIPLNVAEETVAMARRSQDRVRTERQAARERIRAEEELTRPHLVVSLGRLHPFKGIHVLVEAMADLPDTELLIVGPSLRVRGWGDYGVWLRTQARQLGLADRVRLTGPVPHARVLRYLGAADALVVPSLQESLNRVCIEAAAAGTPFVVTASTGVSRFLDEEGVGLVVPPRSPEAIRRALRSVLVGEFRRDGAAARRFVERFAAAAVAPPLAELFARVAAREP